MKEDTSFRATQKWNIQKNSFATNRDTVHSPELLETIKSEQTNNSEQSQKQND